VRTVEIVPQARPGQTSFFLAGWGSFLNTGSTQWHATTPGAKTARWIAERDTRDWRDGRDEVEIQSVYVAPFSHVSRFTHYGLWLWQNFSAS